MTSVGKILVIVIVAFTLIFLGISTVAFTTATPWKTQLTKQTETITRLKSALDKAEPDVQAAQGQYDAVVKTRGEELKARETKLRDLTDANTKALNEIAQLQTELKQSQDEAQALLTDTDARRKDTEALRENLKAVNAQAKSFKDQEDELKARILHLTRMLDASEQDAKVLKERLNPR